MNIPTTKANPYEDFTTYTEVDPQNRISIVGTNHIDLFAKRDYYDAFIYYDYGVGYFTDFIHDVNIRVDDNSGIATGYTWVLANVLKNWRDMLVDLDDSIGITFTAYGDKIRLVENDGGTQYFDDFNNYAINTWYYLTITKSGTSLTCKIYNQDRRNPPDLLDTLSLTLHTDWSFRYIYGACSYGFGTPQDSFNIDVENLDLNKSLVYVTFYNNSGGIFRVDNITIANGTQNDYNVGTIIELASLPQNSTYLFSYFEWDSSNATTNPYDLTIPSNLTVWCYFSSPPTGYVGFSFLFFGLVIGVVCGMLLLIAKKST